MAELFKKLKKEMKNELMEAQELEAQINSEKDMEKKRKLINDLRKTLDEAENSAKLLDNHI